MTDEAMSPLRRRMIEDMTIRKLGRKTQQDYIQIIKKLAAFLGRSPDRATFEDLRRFQLHVVASGAASPSVSCSARLAPIFPSGPFSSCCPAHTPAPPLRPPGH
jgi:hypothetical protein